MSFTLLSTRPACQFCTRQSAPDEGFGRAAGIANLYGFTEEEFAYNLPTFPVAPQAIKDTALSAYREFVSKTVNQQVAALIAACESATRRVKPSVIGERSARMSR